MLYQQMEIMNHSPASTSSRHIEISLAKQQLRLLENNAVIRQYSISSALNGPGEKNASGCTPRGEHKIRIKIGHGCDANTVFQARRPTGELYSAELAKKFPERDWILSRIIWLTGTQSGINRGGEVDTLRRYIYLHGCPDSEPMGVPCSHGCIRMRNEDIIDLFELVDAGMPVLISG
jgi:hypothetical protein